MKKLLLGAALLVVGCDSVTPPRDIDVMTRATAPGIHLHTRDHVSIVMTVHNGSQAPIRVSTFCGRPFDILDASRNVVEQVNAGVCDEGPPVVIAPGDSKDITSVWDGFIGIAYPDDILFVSPGLYSIRPRLLIEGETVYGSTVHVAVSE